MSTSSIILGDKKDTGLNGTSLPNQQVGRNTRNSFKWQKDSIEFYINNRTSDTSIRKSPEEIQANWDFYNSILSYQEMQKHLDPLGVDEGLLKEDELNFNFFDILHQPLDTLFGEELKRQYDVKAYAINPTIINKKDKEFIKKVSEFLVEMAKQDSIDEEAFKKKLEEFDNYRNVDLQSAHEIMANQLLEVFSKTHYIDAKRKFNTLFKSGEIVGESIVRIYHIGKEPNFKIVSSKNFHVLGLGESNWIEDGYAWIEEEYLSVYKIIEEFADELTPTEIKNLMSLSSGEETSLNPTQIKLIDVNPIKDGNPRESMVTSIDYQQNVEAVNLGDSQVIDANNNIRVYRVQYLCLRKIGKLKYYENNVASYTWVDENYIINEDAGEEVEWIWVNELREGVKIANDIYKKLRLVPIQMRSLINPAIVRPSYTGYLNTNPGGGISCRLDRLKEYQRMFNVWMNKLNTLFAQNIGKAAVIDLASIPSDMDTDEWYLWLKRFKISFKNSFEAGKEGQARGLIAGNMQQGNNTIDLSLTQEINTAIMTLSWIEERVNKISAIPDPRQGNMTGREGLGVTQQAIISSSTQTEESFFIQDLLKAKTYTLLIEYTKYLWKEEKGVRQYLLDDLSNKIIDIDGELLNEAEFGVIITNSSRLEQMYNGLQQLTHAAMQNGVITLLDVAKVSLASSPSQMLNLLQSSEDKRKEEEKQKQDSMNQAQQQQIQMTQDFEKFKHQMALELLDREWSYKLQEKELEVNSKLFTHSTDTNQNNIEDEVELEKARITAEAKLEEVKLKIAADKENLDKELRSKEKIASNAKVNKS